MSVFVLIPPLISFRGILSLLGYKNASQGQQITNNAKLQDNQEENRYELDRQEIWLEFLIYKLADCESKGNPLALNKVDKNGLSSKGFWQFQDKTWRYYIQKYNLWNWQEWDEADYENAIWDANYQKVVVDKMFVDKDINLQKEFPTCSKKLKLEKNYAL